MANQFKTSRKTELVALRAAESAAYLTIGSKAYFKDQLKGKRNGTSYDFVIRDRGEYQRGMDISGKGASNLVERKVTKKIQVGNIAIATNLIEQVTEVNWDKEVAYPNGKGLINGTVQDVINGLDGKEVDGVVYDGEYTGDFGNQNTAFTGIGYGPLTAADGYLSSISDEDRFMFIDPMINTKLATTGDAFKSKDADPLFKKGLLGSFGDTEVRRCQFMPLVTVSAALDTAVKAGSGFVYEDPADGSGLATITLGGVNQLIPRGFVVWVPGVYATDLVGDRSGALKAFISVKDGTENGKMIVKAVDEFVQAGTKQLCLVDGSPLGANKTAAIAKLNQLGSAGIKSLEAGNWFSGIIRLDGAMEFEMLDEIDASNADTEMAKNEGVIVFQNRAIDTLKGTNITRWTDIYMAGIVEPRATSLILVKDATTNLVKVVND